MIETDLESATLLMFAGAFMLIAVIAALRLLIGPTAPDRAVALDTINTLVVTGMLILGAAMQEVLFIDVAIVYALLSFITTLYIAKYLEVKGGANE